MTAYVPPYRAQLSEDNNIRKDSSTASYAKLKPAFDRKHGSVTAANSTPLTDGAAAVLMMSESRAKSWGCSRWAICAASPSPPSTCGKTCCWGLPTPRRWRWIAPVSARRSDAHRHA